MLRDLPRVGSYVVAGRKPDQPRYDLRGPWERVCTRARLEDVHVHDLRRTFGLEVAKKSGLHIASKLLRHSDVKVTEKVYVPLGVEDLREALEGRELPEDPHST